MCYRSGRTSRCRAADFRTGTDLGHRQHRRGDAAPDWPESPAADPQCRAEARRLDAVRGRSRSLHGRRPPGRTRQRHARADDEPHQRGQRGVQLQDEARRVSHRGRHREHQAAGADADARRHCDSDGDRPRHRCLFRRRDGRENRSAQIQDHERRLHDVRAAHAAMAVSRRHDHPQHRALHLHAQCGLQRERRAVAVHADHVLPDEEGRPRDRHPHPDDRLVEPARRVDSQRFLPGAGPQSGRDDSPRLVLEDRPGLRLGIPLQLRHAVHRVSAGLHTQRARRRLRPERRDGVHAARRHVVPGAGCRDPGTARPHHGARTHRLLLEPRGVSVVQHELRQRIPAVTVVWRQHRRRLEFVLDERDARPHGLVLERDGVGDIRELAEGVVRQKRETDSRHAALLLCRHGIREPAQKRQRHLESDERLQSGRHAS